MCGFSALISDDPIDEAKALESSSEFLKIQYRGPDESSERLISSNILMSFHRLSIIGVGPSGSQPMTCSDGKVHLVCNGEIYNHKDLNDKFKFDNNTGSDCEVIINLYKKFGIEETLSLLDGVYAFVLYDDSSGVTYSARDPFGVRPSFFGLAQNGFLISSEAKAISNLSSSVTPFPPGSWWSSENPSVFNQFYDKEYSIDYSLVDEYEILQNIRHELIYAVEKRLMAEREVGCLLSGGLDSSLIASLVTRMSDGYRFRDGEWKLFPELKTDYKIKTFSIGLDGSPDLKYAKEVADKIGSDHHEVLLTEGEFLSSIEEVILKIESYDTTTVRASVGNYLISKYISENTDCKVIFNGDGSDEVTCGYVYNINAPTPLDIHKECTKLLREIHLFDVLRSDRSISSNGLEPRTPFLDPSFVRLYMSIPPELKTFDKKSKIEKHLLRKAFEEDDLLPESILWRHKCAFSDGVSDSKRSWHQVIKEFIDPKISDQDFASRSCKIDHCKPLFKESLFYRELFEKHFSNSAALIPHFWMPNWSDASDPSARELSGYKE